MARCLLIECVVRARLQGEAEASALKGEEMDEDEDENKDGEQRRKRQAHRREHGRSSRASDDDGDNESNNAGGMGTDTSRDRLQTGRVNANGSAEQPTAFTFSSSGFERTSPQLPFPQHGVSSSASS